MNKCAIVIPLHPKHFDYGYYIANELYTAKVDLYFVFTDTNDKDNFISKLTNPVNFLILSDFLDIIVLEKNCAYVSVKKLYALSVLYTKYDYISCIDSEIKFLNTNNFYDAMASIVNSKIICGGKMVNERHIVVDSLLRLTDTKYHTRLEELSESFTLYTWWSNLPVYDCKLAKEFLEWIDFNNTNTDRFSYWTFDDMTYNFFCILFHSYEFKRINNCNHSLEFADSDLVEYTDKELCKLYWVNNKAYKQNTSYYENNDFKIVFHLDRF